jgi:hypothetical protein
VITLAQSSTLRSATVPSMVLRPACHGEVPMRQWTISARQGILYGSFDALSGTQKDSIFQEAAHAIEQWEEMAEMGTTPPAPRTPLQGLLREYHEICEQILDIRDKRLR